VALIESVIPATRKDAQIRSYYSMKAKKGSNSAKVTHRQKTFKDSILNLERK